MTHALRIHKLKKTYPGGVEALKGIDLEVEKGDFFALLGPNGAGKSTTIGIVCSLVNKTSGTVEVLGHDIDRELQEAKRRVGVVPQEFNFSIFEPTLQIVVQQAGYYGVGRRIATERAKEYLERLGLSDKLNTPSGHLSGGLKRRLMIARALVHDPELLILDEPTAGVDIELRRSMWDFIRDINAQGKTIILTTHYLEEAESLCRKIAIIDKGEIVENTDMKSLLAKLQVETFVLDLKNELTEAPRFEHCHAALLDRHSLEVQVPKSFNLNRVFSFLDEQGIEVLSMRNKANRLEELFLNLVQGENK